MKQSVQDQIVLGLWAHSNVKTVHEGYAELSRQLRKPPGEVKRLVHEALRRQGANPKHSPSLIHAFTLLNKHNRKGVGHE